MQNYEFIASSQGLIEAKLDNDIPCLGTWNLGAQFN